MSFADQIRARLLPLGGRLARAGVAIAAPSIDREEVSALAARADLSTWHEIATRLDGALTRLRGGTNPELLIDLLALRWPTVGAT